MPMHWTQESLWTKAQVYAERAADEERDGPLFAFWSHLALELLARAAVASIHPALLADRSRSTKSLLYALELGDGTEPKSLGSAELLTLCVEIVPGFTTEHRDAALLMLTRRNRELHTGEPAFEDLPLSAWLADYYRVAKALLAPQDLTLSDLIGIDEAAAAEQMIEALQERVKATVLDLIEGAARAWKRLPADEQGARRTAALTRPRLSMTKSGRCPACETGVQIGGEQVVVSQTRLDRGELVEEVRMLPNRLDCVACGLRLSGHAELHAGGLGGQFTLLHEVDPVEFHSIEIDDYVDPDRYMAIPDGPEYEDE